MDAAIVNGSCIADLTVRFPVVLLHRMLSAPTQMPSQRL